MLKCYGYPGRAQVLSFPDSSVGKESAFNAGDPSSTPDPIIELQVDSLPAKPPGKPSFAQCPPNLFILQMAKLYSLYGFS